MYRNNGFIYEAVSKVDELSKVSIQVNSNEPLEVLLTEHNTTKFFAESRSSIGTSEQGLILSQLEE